MMRALRLRVKLPGESDKAETDVPPEPQPGLFRRILHRAVSKTSSRTASHAPPSPREALPAADAAPQGRHGRRETTPHPRLKPSFRRLRSQPDQAREAEADSPKVRHFEAYVPRHAASDFSRTACSKDGSARFHSFDEDRRGTAPGSFAAERPGTSPGLILAASHHQDRSDAGKLLRSGWTDQDESRSHVAPLQPQPTAPAKRNTTRHSFKLASDPYEAPPEPSDYQKFIQKAVEEDRQHREELWRTISQRSTRGRRTAFVPNHPDLNMNIPVDTTRRERRGSTGAKRTSLLSYRSHADRQDKREPGPDQQLGKRPSNRSLRHKTSVTERIHDYFKPHTTAQGPGRS